MTSRSDNFNRADTTSAIGTPSDGGSAWSQLNSSTWGISGNKGYSSASTDHALCVLEASSAVVTVQATLSGTESSPGLVVRLADLSNYIVMDSSGGFIALRKTVAGATTLLTFASYTFAAGDVWQLDIDASNNITGKVNGVTMVTATDAAGSTNTKHGLMAHFDTGIRFDDFTITDNGGGGGGSVKPWWLSTSMTGGFLR